MCNQETAIFFKVPVACICACHAKYFMCEDDLVEAKEHEEHSHKNNPNHKWVYDVRVIR